jgi:uncharacterized protein (TIGR03437 family)
MQATNGAPRLCSSYASRNQTAAIVRTNTVSSAVIYAGFLNADQSWLSGPDQVIAENAFVGIRQFSLLPAGNPAAGTVTCIASAAVYDKTAIAPGEVLSIFGADIGPADPVAGAPGAEGRFPTELGGMTVSIAGLSAPILYADSGQINLVAPFSIPDAGTVPVEIHRNDLLIGRFDTGVSPYHPALFTRGGSGRGLLAALNQDGSVNSQSNPATRGSVVSVFGTGYGVMSPLPGDGTAPCRVYSRPVTEISAEVFGAPEGSVVSAPAGIQYFGNAPCLVAGVVQINLRIPETIRPASDGTATISLRPGGSGPIALR